MRSLTCIVCPIGCALSVEEVPAAGAPPSVGAPPDEAELIVAGNRCPRGAVYAQEEVRSPKRVVTATCRLGSPRRADPRRLPVKTTAPCPKERIGELLADIYALRVEAPVEAGQGLIVDWKGSGLDVVAARGVR